ncbi:type II toxin-antitoxin system RelE/ParE family toxin [Glycocaulis profundi]|nr:type II toxin-antitoxin system RelE/ParE family toxin [Glycocaulis profundi]
MRFQVVYAPEAEAQLAALYRYIAREASPVIARRYTDDILDHMETFSTLPHRGTPRDDLRPGLRTTSFRRRVAIAYAVEDRTVTILGIFYGGQDFETLLDED